MCLINFVYRNVVNNDNNTFGTKNLDIYMKKNDYYGGNIVYVIKNQNGLILNKNRKFIIVLDSQKTKVWELKTNTSFISSQYFD
jgi:hypothetical protein